MKSTYLFAAITACSAIGAFSGHRGLKTTLCIVSAVLAGYGLVRLIG